MDHPVYVYNYITCSFILNITRDIYVLVCSSFTSFNTMCHFLKFRLTKYSILNTSEISKRQAFPAMTIIKEAFVDLQEKFQKMLKLLENSKSDPVEEPYASKYSARKILIGMKAIIEDLLNKHTEGNPEHIRLIAILGSVFVQLGIIGIDTDEVSTGIAHLNKCKELIEGLEEVPEIIITAINMFNQLGIVRATSDPGMARNYLEKAEQLYRNFKSSGKNPIDLPDLIEPNIEHYHKEIAQKNLESYHTLTLYYLAQIYGALGEDFKSAIYCHITLQRQLDAEEYDSIDWALNAATLSQFFMEKCGFKQARHHLAAASYMLEKYKVELDAVNEPDETHLAKLQTYKHRSADVWRCWTKYGIFLLSKSKDRLLSHTEDIDEKCSLISDLTKMKLSEIADVTSEELNNLSFDSIDVSKYEEEISDQFILTISDAKKVFLKTQEWINLSQQYYSLENLASDYTEIVCDLSQLYSNLLFFEEDPDTRAKLHKRRIDLLENCVNKLNSQYYMQYCRQIWFELGQTYSEILDLKAEKLKESKGRPKPQQLSKINNLVERSLFYYKKFIDSFKINLTQLEKVIDTGEKPFLQTYFHIAALYGRYITLDKDVQIENVKQQYNHYKFVVDYCEKHSKAQEHIPLELEICKEMVSLLPLKILRCQLGNTE